MSSCESRFPLRIVEGEGWPVHLGSLSSQLPTAAADVFYVTLGTRTGAVVSQLRWMSGDGLRLAGRYSEPHSVRHPECLEIADRWSVDGGEIRGVFFGEGIGGKLQWIAR